MKKKLITIITLASLPIFGQTYNSDQFLQDGLTLHSEAKYDEAIQIYHKVHPFDPNYNIAQYEIINSLLADKKYEEALEHSTTLYNQNFQDQFPDLYSLHGITLSSNERLKEALEVFDEGLKKHPYSTNLLLNKAVVYMKQDKNQEALDLYKQIIDIDPTHLTALYHMGVIALEDGKIVEGSLSLMTYLLFEPYNYNSKNALLYLNKKYHQNYANKSQLHYSDKGDNFKELEQILLAQVQYHKDYQLEISIDDIAIRNMQIIVEYFKDHTFKDGYFENKFGKLFQTIAQSGHTKNYLMTSLLSISENFEKEFSRNEKDIRNYINNFLSKDLAESFKYGKRGDQRYYVFREDNEKVFIPVNDANEYEGKGFVENLVTTTRADISYKNNALNGVKNYYFENGILSNRENYVDGEVEGIAESFARNGQKIAEYTVTKGKANGKYKTISPKGFVECEGNYIDGQYDGLSTCYFADGSVQVIANYKAGKLEGEFKKYNQTGTLIISCHYKDNEIDGTYKEFYDDGTLKQEAVYSKGVPQSNVIYHYNKNIQTRYNYIDGKVSQIEYFNQKGQLTKRETYDNKEEYVSIEDFNPEGEKYQTHFFKNGNYSHSEYNIPALNINKNKNKNSYYSYNPMGTLVAEGNFAKNKPIGEWNYYNNSGALTSKVSFDNDGNYLRSEGFLTNGDKDYTINYKNNQYYGLYEDFYNNKIHFTRYYNENGINGPEVTFYDNGIKKSEGFYIDNELYYNFEYFTLEGKKYAKEYYLNGEKIEEEFYLDNSPKKFEYYNKSGNFTFQISPLTKKVITLKNGVLHGKYEYKENDITIYSYQYKNGMLHGKQSYYYIANTLLSEHNYYNGYNHGESKYFDPTGRLHTKVQYVWGYQEGLTTNYLANNQKYLEVNYENDEKHGMAYYYNGSDKKIAAIEYYYGAPIAYQVLEVNGNLSDKKPFESTTQIESFYPNGKKALSLTFKNGLLEGDAEIYYENGNKAFANTYIKGRSNGIQTFYYENGKIYSQTPFKERKYDGTVTYFDENGNKKIEVQYKEDLMHGDFKIYENNTLKKKYTYDTDILVSM